MRGPVDQHFGFSVGEATVHLQSGAFVNCSDKLVFLPGTVKCLRVVKEGQGGLLRLSGLVSVTDRLREAQGLVFT